MRSLELTLRPLNAPNFNVPGLERSIRALQKITSHLSKAGSLDTPDQIAELRESLRRCRRVEGDFSEFTQVPRRKSRLLSLYLMDLGAKDSRELLPVFDYSVAVSILGEGHLKKHLRTQATLLYFIHFGTERIDALAWLAERLKKSWEVENKHQLSDERSRSYYRHAKLLFTVDAPTKVALRYEDGMSFDHFAQSYGIPPSGEFRERLLREVVLKRIRKASSDGIEESLDGLIRSMKDRRMQSGYPLGAEAAQILIDRSIDAFNGKVPDAWKAPIVAYTCDPRIPSPGEQAKWWGWANRFQKEVAIRALTELTLRQFISLLKASLDGTSAAAQFKKRADWLLERFDNSNVIDARLVLHESTFRLVPNTIRQALMPFQTSGGPQHTSFVVLKCTDDVFLIEGTHSFALRGFIGADRFLLRELWSSATGAYFQDSKLRIPERHCDIFQRHHNGDWVWDLSQKFHELGIFWRGL